MEKREEGKKRGRRGMKREEGVWVAFVCEGILRIGAIEDGAADECNAQAAFHERSHQKTRLGIPNQPFIVIARPPVWAD